MQPVTLMVKLPLASQILGASASTAAQAQFMSLKTTEFAQSLWQAIGWPMCQLWRELQTLDFQKASELLQFSTTRMELQ
jgi:hypothetical protein